MTKVRTSKARRDAAVQRISRGESTAEAEARKLHVKPAAVRAWCTMAKRGTRQGRKSNAERAAAKPRGIVAVHLGATEEPDSSSPRLDRAFAAAGVAGDGEPRGDDEDGDAPPLEPATLSPDELVATCEMVRMLGLRIYCGITGVDVSRPEVEALFTFTDREREALKPWAPAAAKYVPALLANSSEVGACVFLGINVVSLWGAMGRLRAYAPRKTQREASGRFGPAAEEAAASETTPPRATLTLPIASATDPLEEEIPGPPPSEVYRPTGAWPPAL